MPTSRARDVGVEQVRRNPARRSGGAADEQRKTRERRGDDVRIVSAQGRRSAGRTWRCTLRGRGRGYGVYDHWCDGNMVVRELVWPGCGHWCGAELNVPQGCGLRCVSCSPTDIWGL